MDAKKRTGRATEARRAGKLMRQLQVETRAALDEALRDSQVTSAQLRFLYEVQRHPGISGAQAARACSVTAQSAQAMLMRAVERGWVERGWVELGHKGEHGHTRTLLLTEAGKRLLLKAEGILAALEAKIWQGVPLADLRLCNTLFERALENCREL